jgi:hypothetical protein
VIGGFDKLQYCSSDRQNGSLEGILPAVVLEHQCQSTPEKPGTGSGGDIWVLQGDYDKTRGAYYCTYAGQRIWLIEAVGSEVKGWHR